MAEPTPGAIPRLNAALEGRYRVERQLGEGGMATVYLADDLRHERKVALKVLKPELAAVVGGERFLAEIKTTANLQHPHILPLFDSGEADGFLYYVMPYVEGESLREKLDRERQLGVEEAVRIATNVAEALEYAHSHGVIHRDIKPANILLQAGKPVLSDFGIALAVSAAGGGRLTETGLSLGTPHYMSPEQATGDQSVGPGTDLYALGCVLYEMLVGEPPYTGSTAQAILGKIIQAKPVSATEARQSVPANVDAAIRKSLEKLSADRFTGAQEFARALASPGFRHGELAAGVTSAPASGPWNRLTVAFAVLFGVAAVALAVVLLRPGPAEPPAPLVRLPTPFQSGQLPIGRMRFTPDGSALVYLGTGSSGTGTQLWIRRWDDLVATPIRGTEATGTLTFAISPDGTEVAFTELSQTTPLRAVPLNGGPARTIAEERVATVDDWGRDGYVYGTFDAAPGARMGRVPEAGTSAGEIEPLAELAEGETIHGSFELLPGGDKAVFQVWHAPSGLDAEIWVLDVETRERRFLTAGINPWYAPTGHLLYGTPQGTLMAAPIDPVRGELTGPSVPLVEGLSVRPPYGTMDYALSDTGTLIYSLGVAQAGAGTAELVWVSRHGDATPVDRGWTFDPSLAGGYGWALSPDGRRIATTRQVEGALDIWIKQLPDGPFDRLTFSEDQERFPVWTPDGQSVTYSRGRPGAFSLWQRRADGTGDPTLLLDEDRTMTQSIWSPDGSWLIFATGDPSVPAGVPGVMSFRPGTDSVAVPLVDTNEFNEVQPAISPDGRWLAYTSDESGQAEVYVRPFPDVDSGRVRVSTEGGREPLWSRSGDELFFVDAANNLVAARVDGTSDFTVSGREILFPIGPEFGIGAGSAFMDISPDDQQLLMARLAGTGAADSEGPRYVLVQNFFEQLRQVAPD